MTLSPAQETTLAAVHSRRQRVPLSGRFGMSGRQTGSCDRFRTARDSGVAWDWELRQTKFSHSVLQTYFIFGPCGIASPSERGSASAKLTLRRLSLTDTQVVGVTSWPPNSAHSAPLTEIRSGRNQ